MTCLSRTVKAVCTCIKDVVGPQYLKLPKDVDEMKTLISLFETRFGFPQAFGCLDGNHIPLRQPIENSQAFFCYKMKYSLHLLPFIKEQSMFIRANRIFNSAFNNTNFNNTDLTFIYVKLKSLTTPY